MCLAHESSGASGDVQDTVLCACVCVCGGGWGVGMCVCNLAPLDNFLLPLVLSLLVILFVCLSLSEHLSPIAFWLPGPPRSPWPPICHVYFFPLSLLSPQPLPAPCFPSHSSLTTPHLQSSLWSFISFLSPLFLQVLSLSSISPLHLPLPSPFFFLPFLPLLHAFSLLILLPLPLFLILHHPPPPHPLGPAICCCLQSLAVSLVGAGSHTSEVWIKSNCDWITLINQLNAVQKVISITSLILTANPVSLSCCLLLFLPHLSPSFSILFFFLHFQTLSPSLSHQLCLLCPPTPLYNLLP